MVFVTAPTTLLNILTGLDTKIVNLYAIGVCTRTSMDLGNYMNKKSIHDIEVAEVLGYFMDLALQDKEEENDDDIQSVE